MSVETSALFKYLADQGAEYRAKLFEVRDEVKRWLAYVPQTFPHYTQHTVEHSEAIIDKLSKLLFQDDDPARPTIRLSGVECYVLSAAAYLHDAGMVTSDREKDELLRSHDWKSWVDGGGGAARWREIEAMRDHDPRDPLRNFAADRQVRFLIAEFIRRRHHRRAADVISQHHAALGRLDFGDGVLRTTIADVCVAHGLDRSELGDRERFPERREIRGQLVNVRFLAALLRIGDLLDMRHDRACSLLLAAACPLPADSYAHWTQYQRITHELVAPDRIELRAECMQQEEHRFLFDWCTWLVDEVRSAAVLMANSPRHNTWRAPVISLGDGQSGETITIRPARSAVYIPRKWQFELDATAVFERLIRDVYNEPEAFLRELIQNALDAMRCQMYADLRHHGRECPEYSIDVPADWLARYELQISLETEAVKNPLSGEDELRQVVVVDDSGIGMDQEVIERYFLQVGQSYYTSDSFRREFPFHPVSRFGVGFLSVFAVSDHVTVETLRTHGVAGTQPIRLTLTGPRSYLLAERGRRTSPGTRIAVRLKDPLAPGRLTTLVRHWCRRVEFAIKVTDQGAEETVVADDPEHLACETADPSDPDAMLAMRVIPVAEPGVRGELYVLARVTDDGEAWDEGLRIHQCREKYPFSSLPPQCSVAFCEHGLLRAFGEAPHGYNFGCVLDDRRPKAREIMDRASVLDLVGSSSDVLQRAWEASIRGHLERSAHAAGDHGWRYAHRIARYLEFSWWTGIPATIPLWTRGVMSRHSVDDMIALERFTTLCGSRREERYFETFPVSEAAKQAAAHIDGPVLFSEDVTFFARHLCAPLFAQRRAVEVHFVRPDAVAMTWMRAQDDDPPDTCKFFDHSIIGIRVHSRSGYADRTVLNMNHALVAWTRQVMRTRTPGVGMLWEYLCRGRELPEIWHLVQQYRRSDVSPPPPDVEITESSYLTDFAAAQGVTVPAS